MGGGFGFVLCDWVGGVGVVGGGVVECVGMFVGGVVFDCWDYVFVFDELL